MSYVILRKTGVIFVAVKASSSQIRHTRVPNMGRWIIYKENTKDSYKIRKKKIQIQRIQTKNKTVFIPDKVHKQNLPPYQHKVCAPIWNISHIISTLLHYGLQRNDQYRTHNQRLVPLHPSNHQRKERLVLCWNLIKCQTELDPGKPSLLSFWSTKKNIRRKPIDFGFSGLFYFHFMSCPNKFSVSEFDIFFAVLPQVFGCRFKFGTGLISDARRDSAEVNGEK